MKFKKSEKYLTDINTNVIPISLLLPIQLIYVTPFYTLHPPYIYKILFYFAYMHLLQNVLWVYSVSRSYTLQ